MTKEEQRLATNKYTQNETLAIQECTSTDEDMESYDDECRKCRKWVWVWVTKVSDNGKDVLTSWNSNNIKSM